MNVLAIDEYAPLFYIFMASAGYAFQVFFQKILNEDEFHDQFDAVFVKGLVQLGLAGVLVYFDEDRQAFRKPLLGASLSTTAVAVFRALIHFATIVFTFLALDTLPYGDATVFILGGPVFAGALALVFLDEPWFICEMGSLALCLLGVALVIKPPMLFNSFSGDNGGERVQPHFHASGVLYGVLAAASHGLGFLTLRMLGTSNKLSWKNVCLLSAAVQVILAVPSVFLAGESFNLSLRWDEYGVLFATGLVAAVAQFCLTAGLQNVKVAVGTTVLLSQVVVGLVLQATFIRDNIDWVSIFGAVIVCIGVILLMIYKKSDNDVLLHITQRALELDNNSVGPFTFNFTLAKPNNSGFSRSVLLSNILGRNGNSNKSFTDRNNSIGISIGGGSGGSGSSSGQQAYSPVPLYDRDEESDDVNDSSDSDEES